MSIYKLVTIDQRFIAETIARTGSEQLLNKVARSFFGLYNQDENWYIPLRANLGKKKPERACFETPFKTSNKHFKRPGLDFEKSIFVPVDYTIEIRNTLPLEQSELIFTKQEEIRQSFESYVVGLDQTDKNSINYKFSTVPLFPEGIDKIKKMGLKVPSLGGATKAIEVENSFLSRTKKLGETYNNWFKGMLPQNEVIDQFLRLQNFYQENFEFLRNSEDTQINFMTAELDKYGELPTDHALFVISDNIQQFYFLQQKEKKSSEVQTRKEINKTSDQQFTQEALFENMIDVLPESKSEKNLFWYSLDLRPVSIGTHPNKNNNPIIVDTSFINSKGRKYGAVGYEQAISESDTENYDLTFIGLGETAERVSLVGSNHKELEVGQILFRIVKTSEHKINQVAKITSIDDQDIRMEWVERINGKGAYHRNDESNLKTYTKESIESEWQFGRETHERIFNKSLNDEHKVDVNKEDEHILRTEKLRAPEREEERSIQQIIKQKDYKALSSHLKNGISSYLETDIFKNYLNFVSKFHKYSHRNVRLLLSQNPETTRVAGYKKWQEVGRTVNKGAKALYVYAPGSKIMKDKNGKPVKDENGQVVKEKFFFLTPVFDVSQTNGDPIPKPIHDLEGDFETPEQFVKVYKAIENISPVPVKIEPIEGSARGYYHKLNKEIVVKNGLGEMMTLKTLIHEITHAKLHTDSTCVFGDTKYSQQEFEAESVAYIVSNHLGIDTSDYSFGYLASWTKQGQSVDSFTESLDRITKEAQQLIESLDKSLSLSFAMAEPANKFEERVAKAQGRDIQPAKSEKKSVAKEIEPELPKEERPRLNP